MSAAGSLSAWQQFLLVVFRFSVGWHIFYQGLGKYQAVHWSSEAYLRSATGPVAGVFHKLADTPWMLRTADLGTLWGLMIVGLLVMVGLFTRTASVLGILLLLLFYAAQPPLPLHGFAVRTPDGSELYVNKVLIEILALLVTLAFDTGRISGLDLLLQGRLRRKWHSDASAPSTAAQNP